MADLIISGPRKRKETRRVTDNADPLLKNKKARLATIHIPSDNAATKTKALRRHPSVEIQDVDDDGEATTTQLDSPKNPDHIIEPVDSDDNENDLEGPNSDVDGKDKESEEESAKDELRESITKLN
jgi:hypothetical protein